MIAYNKTEGNENKVNKEKKNYLQPLPALTPSSAQKQWNSPVFYTIWPSANERKEDSSSARAVITEAVLAYMDSRITFQLTQDAVISNIPLPTGTTLFGSVNGFTTQRILIHIEGIKDQNKVIPVTLDVYDMDGLKGLYVPASNFRNYTKDIGSETTSTTEQLTNSSDKFTYRMLNNLLNRAYQASSKAISKSISQNKAYLREGTQVLLVGSKK